MAISAAKMPLAPKRNHLKRLIREFFRTNKGQLKGGPYDITVALQKPLGPKIDYSTVESRLLQLLKKAKAR